MTKKHVVIFYGEMGAGKSYMARKFHLTHNNYEFLEGDDYLPLDMKNLVLNFKNFSNELIIDFICSHLGPAIVNKSKHNNIVVAQALYRKEHRQILQQYLESNNIAVDFVVVNTSFITNIKRLWSRPQGLRWIIYHLLNKPFFQEK